MTHKHVNVATSNLKHSVWWKSVFEYFSQNSGFGLR